MNKICFYCDWRFPCLTEGGYRDCTVLLLLYKSICFDGSSGSVSRSFFVREDIPGIAAARLDNHWEIRYSKWFARNPDNDIIGVKGETMLKVAL